MTTSLRTIYQAFGFLTTEAPSTSLQMIEQHRKAGRVGATFVNQALSAIVYVSDVREGSITAGLGVGVEKHYDDTYGDYLGERSIKDVRFTFVLAYDAALREVALALSARDQVQFQGRVSAVRAEREGNYGLGDWHYHNLLGFFPSISVDVTLASLAKTSPHDHAWLTRELT